MATAWTRSSSASAADRAASGYYAANRDGTTWTRSTLDEGGMAAAGCVAVDLNGDGRVDVACIGTATANLKWYENLGRK